jgi:hypothetical protein
MTFYPEQITEDEVDAVWVGIWAATELGIRGPILALDLGQRFAWAWIQDGQVTMCGWYDTTRKGEGGGAALFRFNKAVVDLLDGSEPVLLAWESPAKMSPGSDGITKQAGLLEMIASDRKIAHATVAPNTLKKWATGKGNCSKDRMRAALIARLKT